MGSSKSRRLRNWLASVAVAAVTAGLIQMMTGAFTSIGSRLWALFTKQQPIQVAMASDFVSFHRDQKLSYVIPRSIDQIPPPPRYLKDPVEKFEQWAASLGAVEGPDTDVLVTVTGRSPAPVVLTNLRVTVVDRRPPLRGLHVRTPTAGPLNARYFNVNLDASPPTLESIDEFEDHPVKFPYRVSATEPEVFYISARTEKCDCTWIAELFWTAGDKKGSTIIKNNGKPFRTTSVENLPTYHFGEAGLSKFEQNQ